MCLRQYVLFVRTDNCDVLATVIWKFRVMILNPSGNNIKMMFNELCSG